MKCYLTEYIHEDILKKIKEEFEISTNLCECEIVITRSLNVNKEFIDSAKKLKCIAMHGTGLDLIDIDYAKQKGIVVFNSPKMNCLSVAELNVGLMIAFSRKFEECFKEVRIDQNIDYLNNLGLEISGKTVGFIGIGEISLLTANMLKYGFNCNLIGYNRTYKENIIINQMSMEEVLKNSDYILLGMALNDHTRGIINLDKLKLMKKTAILVNTTRAGLIVYEDLLYALQNKIIFGYASDVTHEEPIKTDDLLLKENVMITPHVGGNTKDCLYRVGELLFEELMCFKNNLDIKYKI